VRRRLCAATLSLEAIMLALTAPVLIHVADVARPTALGSGLGLAVLAVIAAGSLRGPAGYALGHLVQVCALGLGLLLHSMVVLGLLFAVLWTAAYLLGRRIDLDRGTPSA